jgi:hypothetical protein
MATILIPDESKNLAVNKPTFPKPCIESLNCFLIHAMILLIQVLLSLLLVLKPLHSQWFLVHEVFLEALEVFQYKHAYRLFHVRIGPHWIQRISRLFV